MRAKMSRSSYHSRLDALEARIPPESRDNSWAREAIRAQLDRIATARRTGGASEGWSEEELEAEVEALREAIQRRLRELRGEGA
jgi:hypothetical protein